MTKGWKNRWRVRVCTSTEELEDVLNQWDKEGWQIRFVTEPGCEDGCYYTILGPHWVIIGWKHNA